MEEELGIENGAEKDGGGGEEGAKAEKPWKRSCSKAIAAVDSFLEAGRGAGEREREKEESGWTVKIREYRWFRLS